MNEEIKENVPKKNHSLSIIIILLGIVLIGVGLFLFFGTDLFKSEKKDEKKPDQTVNTVNVDKFVGIYAAENNKLYIKKSNDKAIAYVLGDSFFGTAIVTGDTAKETNTFSNGEYFEFKVVDGGINVSYVTDEEDASVVVDTGLYKKVADYSKDNVYKEAVGDSSLLNSKYSGIYKKGTITLYVYQMNETQVKVETTMNSEQHLSEVFDITSDNKLVAKDFFEEDENAFEITFGDKEFNLVVNENVFGFDEDDKEFAGTYTFDSNITQDIIMDEFYKYY